jgi:hypothetical protein
MKEFIVYGYINGRGQTQVRVFAQNSNDAMQQAKKQFGMTSFAKTQQVK